MKRVIVFTIFLWMGIMGINAQNNQYDLNNDGNVNDVDVTLLLTYILGKDNSYSSSITVNLRYDMNNDKEVNIIDAVFLVNYILDKMNENQDTKEAIDLGLPSGTKWASCNVGATKPEEFGGYFAWGETEEKDYYDWDNYIHCDGSQETCHDLGNDISGTEYDVAHVKWGGNWCIPSRDEFLELRDNCTSQWITLNGVKGRKFTSKINGNSIFLPAAGVCEYGIIYYSVSFGHYWLSTKYSLQAYQYYFNSGLVSYGNIDRHHGHSIRPVIKDK